ncbi:hypothetical protein LPJ56_004412, partial [Coemansia sp. RSA 2599]
MVFGFGRRDAAQDQQQQQQQVQAQQELSRAYHVEAEHVGAEHVGADNRSSLSTVKMPGPPAYANGNVDDEKERDSKKS